MQNRVEVAEAKPKPNVQYGIWLKSKEQKNPTQTNPKKGTTIIKLEKGHHKLVLGARFRDNVWYNSHSIPRPSTVRGYGNIYVHFPFLLIPSAMNNSTCTARRCMGYSVPQVGMLDTPPAAPGRASPESEPQFGLELELGLAMAEPVVAAGK